MSEKPKNDPSGDKPSTKPSPENPLTPTEILTQTKLAITYLSVSDIKPYKNNPRTHSAKQLELIKHSIKTFGMCTPIGIANNTIVYGHARFQVMQELGFATVPTVDLSHLNSTQRKAYVLADNQLANLGAWDNELLKIEMADLQALDVNLLTLGFTTKDLLDNLISVEDREYEGEPDATPKPLLDIKPGDIYQLGRHRLMCGDATLQDNYQVLLGDTVPDIIYTDPPYGIDVVKRGGKEAGRIGTGGRSRNGKFYKCTKFLPVTNDHDSETAKKALDILLDIEAKFVCIWGGNYFTDVLPPSRGWLIWDKKNYDRLDFADGEMAWTNIDKSVRIYQQPWLGFQAKNSDPQIKSEGRTHPNQKPETLAVWAMDKFCPEGKTVLDVFSGSGSTLLACETKGLTCYAMEYEPAYVDLIIQRWEKRSGSKAVLMPRTV